MYASAHDLRRSFGFRWAKRVMPLILQKLMRHADITTTMEFYVTQNEAQTAEAVSGPAEHAESHALGDDVDVSPLTAKEGTKAERMRVSSRSLRV